MSRKPNVQTFVIQSVWFGRVQDLCARFRGRGTCSQDMVGAKVVTPLTRTHHFRFVKTKIFRDLIAEKHFKAGIELSWGFSTSVRVFADSWARFVCLDKPRSYGLKISQTYSIYHHKKYGESLKAESTHWPFLSDSTEAAPRPKCGLEGFSSEPSVLTNYTPPTTAVEPRTVSETSTN